MPTVRPFAAYRYAPANRNVSSRVAPPYDVLDERRKQKLLAADPFNIVAADLPFTPPKVAGPDEVYRDADATLKTWIHSGTLKRDGRAGFYPYTQSYDVGGRTVQRRGFFALVKLSPFGGGEIVPHEKTFDGPIEDRLELMRATGMQLSPIFGLFSDAKDEVNAALFSDAGLPLLHGELDGVTNRLWQQSDAAIEARVIDAMKDKPIYIADGHHRYTTALAYQRELLDRGPLPESHPANYCLFVLIPMQDSGLIIRGTHRTIGGLRDFSFEKLRPTLAPHFDIVATPFTGDFVDELADTLPGYPPHSFGFYDRLGGKVYVLTLKNLDLLDKLEPNKSPGWRQLDVAIAQRFLIDYALAPFAGGKPIAPGYTADPKAIVPLMDATDAQLAILLQPTPLTALEALGKTGEVMPPKSTYFFPKLATGMVMASLTP